jgi:dipeptidase E
LPAGYAADDGAALHFIGRRLHRVVSSRPAAKAYRVASVRGRIAERPLETEYLGSRRRSAR